MPLEKKTPMRQCTGCREMKPKRELVRIVRSPAGEVAIDPLGKAPGRGAYVCRNPECLKKAVKTKALDRALEMTISPEILAELSRKMEG